MNTLNSETFFDCLTDIVAVNRNSTILTAFSGGADSTVLLHLLQELRNDVHFKLEALHVDHDVNPQSKAWERQCKEFCQSIDVKYHCKRLSWTDNQNIPTENDLREARYRWFKQQMSEGDVLVTAHHQNDQVETFLLNLMRGSGARGLSAMQAGSNFGGGKLVRPLLNISREQILQYATEHSLLYIDDPTNQNLTYDRNYLRHVVVPCLENRWSAASAQIARSASFLSDARVMMEQIGKADLKACESRGSGFLSIGCQLSVEKIKTLDKARQINLIRYWIRSCGLGEPRRNSLGNLIDSVIQDGARHYELGGLDKYRICCYSGNLYLASNRLTDTRAVVIPWNLEQPLYISEVERTLVPTRSTDRGIRVGAKDKKFTVRFRTGGERISLPGRKHSSSLKKLFQHHGIPPWERSQLPLIYQGETLVAVIPWLYASHSDEQSAEHVITITID